jgi:hypothetical protein
MYRLVSGLTSLLLFHGVASAQGALEAPCFISALGTPLHLGDDQVAPNNALGFTFPGPGGIAVQAIDISSNGFVWLASNSNAACCNGNITAFVSEQPRIAAMWTDLFPPGHGDVFFNTLPASAGVPARAIVTWNDVPEYATVHRQTFQLQMFEDGSFAIAFDERCSVDFHDALIGVTQGSSAIANIIDFSAITVPSPHDSGGNPTVVELQNNVWDLAGRFFAFVPNGQGGYLVLDRPECSFAAANAFGRGCPSPAIAFELFANGAIDLSNLAIEFTPLSGGAYVAAPTTGFFASYANNLSLGDDQVSGPLSLPFAFTYGTTSTTAIATSSNGFVWLDSTQTSSRCCVGDPQLFAADAASIAALWMDLNPQSGGAVYFDVVGAAEAHVTWLNVPEYQSTGANTAQITLRSDGSFRLAWGAVANINHAALVGYSQGNATDVPGPVDFSAGPITTSAGGRPLVLRPMANTRPVIGTTFTMDVDQIATNSTFGIFIIGRGSPGIDLTGIGMPACTLHAALDIVETFGLTQPVSIYTLQVPVAPGLVGRVLYTQAATWTPGGNSRSLFTSNGLELRFGF